LNVYRRIMDQGPEPDTALCLLQSGADVNSRSDFGSTVLMSADDALLPLLFRHGADVRLTDQSGEMALNWAVHSASRSGSIPRCRLLLDWGAPVDHPRRGGCTPLMDAAEEGYLEIVRLLLDHGANPLLRDGKGQTARDLAADPGALRRWAFNGLG